MISIFFAQDQNEGAGGRKDREIFLKQKLEEEEERTRLNGVLNSQKEGKVAKGYRRKVWVVACVHAQW